MAKPLRIYDRPIDLLKPPAQLLMEHEDEERLHRFTDAALIAHPGHIAAREGLRLAPYFNALSLRLQQLGQTPLRYPDSKRTFASLTGEKLARIFEQMTATTKSVITSVPLILPDRAMDLLEKSSETLHDAEIKMFFKEAEYVHGSYKFGFFQYVSAPQSDHPSSISIPAFLPKTSNLATMRPYKPEKFMSAMQAIVTYGNHDMLHHFTNTFLNSDIATTSGHSDNTRLLHHPRREYFGLHGTPDASPLSYESWAVSSHAATWKELATSGSEEPLRAAMKVYFRELSRIVKEHGVFMDDLAWSHNTPIAIQHHQHEIADYFNMIPALCLARLVPLNSPLFQDCLTMMQKADRANDLAVGMAVANLDEEEIASIVAGWSNEKFKQALSLLKEEPRGVGLPGYNIMYALSLIEATRYDVYEHLEESAWIKKFASAPRHYLLDKGLGKDLQSLAKRHEHTSGKASEFLRDIVAEAYTRKKYDREQEIIDAYATAGLPLNDANHIDYKTIKMRQIIKMIPDIVALNTPALPGSMNELARKKAEAFDRHVFWSLGLAPAKAAGIKYF